MLVLNFQILILYYIEFYHIGVGIWEMVLLKLQEISELTYKFKVICSYLSSTVVGDGSIVKALIVLAVT